MRVYEVRVDLTRKVADYESDRIGISALLDEGEDAIAAIRTIKGDILADFRGESPTGIMEFSTSVVEKEAAPVAKEEAAPKKKKAAPAKKKVEGKTVPVVAEEEPTSEVETAIEKDKEEVKKEAVKKKAPAKKKTKTTPYDRSNDIHKKLLGMELDAGFEGWRKDANLKKKCVAASHSLEGTDFLDEFGAVLESFKEALSSAI
tara:strand:- start:287 stop:895 length:609 start_codon:yes stop_codon:yes gene_type:complete